MPPSLRHMLLAAPISGMLLLLAACGSSVGSSSKDPAAPAPVPAPAPVSISVTVSGAASVTLGSSAQYVAKVVGSTNQAVTWSVNDTPGGTAEDGTISTSGVYVAPMSLPASGAVSVTAISVANPAISNSVSVSFQRPAVPVNVATATAAARFLDQTTFGPTADTIAHVQQIGLAAALQEQFAQPATLFGQPKAPQAECYTGTLHCTQSDFLQVTAWGNDQLRQRVAMVLSEIWVAPSTRDNAMPFYLNTLATDAFTNYRTIMEDVTLTPEMGAYLNMANSGTPGPGQIANENYARELMQLFTMGAVLLNADGTPQLDGGGDTIPAYSELQVEAFARAYTGWTYASPNGSALSGFNYTANWHGPMVAIESQHDADAKTVLLGTTLPAAQTAEQDLKGALDNIFAHPNVGPFVCRQLIQHLVTGNPSPAYVQRVAAVFADNGNGVRGDMKAVITAIVLDQEARAGDLQTGDQAESNPAVDGGHLREPLLWTLNVLRGLGASPAKPNDPYPYVYFMTEFLGTMGEAPFTQASVFNYFSPAYVVPHTTINSPEFGLENTGTIAPRLSVANAIVHNAATNFTIDLSASSPIGQHAADPAQLADYLGMLFMHSQMPTDMRSILIATISAIPPTDLQARAQVATYLVVTSSQYKIMH